MTGCPNGCARPYLAEIGLVGKGPGRYNLYLGAAFDGSRLAKLYAEDMEHDGIIAALDPLFAAYAKERHSGERFGDFVIRAALWRRPEMAGILMTTRGRGGPNKHVGGRARLDLRHLNPQIRPFPSPPCARPLRSHELTDAPRISRKNPSIVVTVGQADDGKDVSQWLRVACFGEVAEKIAAHAKKCDRVYVEGAKLQAPPTLHPGPTLARDDRKAYAGNAAGASRSRSHP